MFTDIAKHKRKGNCLLLIKGSRGRCQSLLLANLSKSKPLVQGKALCPRIFAQVMATSQWQYYLSKSMATCRSKDCLSKSRLLVNDLIVRVKAATCQACLSMTTCPSQGYLSMACLSMATFQVKADRQWQGHLSKASCHNNDCLLKQRLLVPSQGCLSMTACPSQNHLSRSRLLLNGHLSKARSRQDYLSKTTCPRQGCLSWATLLVVRLLFNGCLSK